MAHSDKRFGRFLIAASLVAGTAAPVALAQRGETGTAELKPLDLTPTGGYPGFFDTNLVHQGGFVLELPTVIANGFPLAPSLELDYGVSPTLTIGTNALVTGVPWLAGGRGGSVKVRSLVYGSGNFEAVATFYAGDLVFGSGTSKIEGNYTFATNNDAWVLSPKNIILGSAMVGRFEVQQASPTDVEYLDASEMIVALGGGYQHIFSDRFALTAFAMLPAYQQTQADTVGGSVSLANNDVTSEGSFRIARLYLDMRAGKSWLLSYGLVHMSPIYNSVSPWFTAAVRW